jgi:Tfp pilus assembly PilM family ATPase
VNNEKKLNRAAPIERLLSIIRGKSVVAEHKHPPPPETLPSVGEIKSAFSKAKSSSSVTIGIDIGYEYVNLVKTARSQSRWEILEYKSIPIPAHLDKISREFIEFLKSVVTPFCTGANKIETWAIMSSAQVEVRMIRVPNVSGKNLEAAIYWTLKKETSLDEKNFFFDYAVRGETGNGPGNKRLNVMCYTVPFAEVESIKKLFTTIGTPLSGVSIVPFAVQNIFLNKVVVSEKQTACLFFGSNHSRIDLYTEGKLTLTRNVKTGISSIIELMTESLNGLTGEGGRLTHEEARRILFAFAESGNDRLVPVNGFSGVPEEIESIIAPVLERLARQMERTFEHFTSVLGYDRIEKVYISCAMPIYKAMLDYFDAQLGIECAIFDPLEQALGPSSLDERISFIPAFGMALSDNANTPNFIYSRKDKKKAAYIAKFNRLVLVGLIVSVFICSSVTIWLWQSASQKKSELTRLEQQQKGEPVVSRETVLQIVAEAGQKQQQYAELSRRYRAIALIGEISALTPESVSLTGLKVDLAEKSGNEKSGQAVSGKSENTAIVEGIISGYQDIVETTLDSYVMKLRSSPMFSEVSVSKSKMDSAGGKALLVFALNLKVGQEK